MMLVATILSAAVIFTGTYPQDARQKIGQRQPYNPVVQLNCGSYAFQQTIVQTEHRNRDRSWTGTFYPLPLDYPSGTSCTAVLVSWDRDIVPTFWATSQFTVP